MTRINPEDWLKNRFVEARGDADVLRAPSAEYDRLPIESKNEFRQTQVDTGEIVRLLGESEGFSLIMRFDRTLGWLPSRLLGDAPGAGGFVLPRERVSPKDFFRKWIGTPYVWGGTRASGIDCSGFTQRYFLEVFGKVIPKNSHDQRKLVRPRKIGELSDHDLIFCYRIGGSGIHHVALFQDSRVCHARLEQGVVSQSLEEFLALYRVEQVGSMIDLGPPIRLVAVGPGTSSGEARVDEVCRAIQELYQRVGYRAPWQGYLAFGESQCVGTCAFKAPPVQGQVEISYYTFPEFEGRGFGSAMAEALIKIALESEPGLKVVAQTRAEEGPSTSILKKLGFQRTGAIRVTEGNPVWKWLLTR